MLDAKCLLEIFKYLSPYDLANVKDICQRLGELADLEFSSESRKSLVFKKHHIEEHIKVLKAFGPFVKDLAIYFRNPDEIASWRDFLSVMNGHCTENLKRLVLRGRALSYVTKEDVLLMKESLKNIEELVIICWYKSEVFGYILSQCEKAKTIILECELDYKTLMSSLHTLIQKNKDLVHLELFWEVGATGYNDSTLKSVVDILMNTKLEQLAFGFYDPNDFNLYIPDERPNLNPVVRLKQLKNIGIYNFCCSEVNSFLENSVISSLNELALACGIIDQKLTATLGQMTQLKVLKLINCKFGTDAVCTTAAVFTTILGLCESKNIEHLMVLYDDSFDLPIEKQDFLKIIEKRKSSKAENCLHLTLNRAIYKASLKAISSVILEANKGIVKLMDQHDSSYEYNNNHFRFCKP